MKYPFFHVLFFLFSFQLQAQNADDIVGIWRHPDGDLLVKIDRIGNSYQGRITWMANPTGSDGKPLLDVLNPESRLRNMPLKGNRILQKLTFNPSVNIWEEGLYYVFSEGKTYNCKVTLLDKMKIKISRYSRQDTVIEEEVWSRYQ